MPVSLATDILPRGVRAGTPIDKADDAYSTNGGTEYSVGLPISDKAQGGDVIQGWIALDFQNLSTPIAGFATIPSGFFTLGSGNFALDFGGSPKMIQMQPLYRVCPGTAGKPSPDAGKTIGLKWNASLIQLGWALVLYYWRFVDTSVVFDVTGTYATSGTTPSQNTVTGANTSATNGALFVGAIATVGGSAVGVGISPGSLPGWYNTKDTVQGVQPNLGFVTGIADIPQAGVSYLGAGCQWSEGSTGGIFTDWVGTLVALRPSPAPAAQTVTVTSGSATVPSGGHADAAGQSGAPFAVHWGYIPVRGQQGQEAFLIGRQRNADGLATGYWNADDNVWETSEYWNYQTIDDYTFPSGAWADDNTVWKLFVSVRDKALHLRSNLSTGFVFTAQAPSIVLSPTVTGTGPKPTVNWAETLDSGTTQASWRVRIFTVAQTVAAGFDPNATTPIEDSGYTLGTALTWTLTTSLASGTAYRAYVQVSDTRGLVSNWVASASFTPSYSTPAPGSLVVVLSP